MAVTHTLFVGAVCAALVAGALPRLSPRQKLRGSELLAMQQPSAGLAAADGALSGLTEEEAAVARWLASDAMGQSHLFAGWEGAAPADKRRLLAQVMEMDARYPEDATGARGLAAYVSHARQLLADAAADKNPFEGYSVGVPEGERMDIGTEAFRADERNGAGLLRSSVFVLVAGGLGERLGFNGIKVALPAETLSGTSFLGIYASAIAAIREAALAEDGCEIEGPPLVIMTSEDTHEMTIALLEAEDYYGLDRRQVSSQLV